MLETITVAEHARLRGVTLTHVYNELSAGRIPGARKVGRIWRIPMRSAAGKLNVRTTEH